MMDIDTAMNVLFDANDSHSPSCSPFTSQHGDTSTITSTVTVTGLASGTKNNNTVIKHSNNDATSEKKENNSTLKKKNDNLYKEYGDIFHEIKKKKFKATSKYNGENSIDTQDENTKTEITKVFVKYRRGCAEDSCSLAHLYRTCRPSKNENISSSSPMVTTQSGKPSTNTIELLLASGFGDGDEYNSLPPFFNAILAVATVIEETIHGIGEKNTSTEIIKPPILVGAIFLNVDWDVSSKFRILSTNCVIEKSCDSISESIFLQRLAPKLTRRFSIYCSAIAIATGCMKMKMKSNYCLDIGAINNNNRDERKDKD